MKRLLTFACWLLFTFTFTVNVTVNAQDLKSLTRAEVIAETIDPSTGVLNIQVKVTAGADSLTYDRWLNDAEMTLTHDEQVARLYLFASKQLAATLAAKSKPPLTVDTKPSAPDVTSAQALIDQIKASVTVLQSQYDMALLSDKTAAANAVKLKLKPPTETAPAIKLQLDAAMRKLQ